MLVSDHWNFTDISFILQFVLYTYWNPLCHNITNLASKGFSLLWVHFWSKQIEIFSLHILWNPLYPIIYDCTIIFLLIWSVYVLNISISQHYICTCSELPIVNLSVLMLPSSNAHLFNVQLCFMVYIHCKILQLILVKNLSIYMYTFHYYFCFILVPSNLVVYIGVLCVKSLFCL